MSDINVAELVEQAIEADEAAHKAEEALKAAQEAHVEPVVEEPAPVKAGRVDLTWGTGV